MYQELEKEIKILLTKEQYQKTMEYLSEQFLNRKEVTQMNYYISNRMKHLNSGTTLRLRISDEVNRITIKKTLIHDFEKTSAEFHIDCSEEESAEIIKNGISKSNMERIFNEICVPLNLEETDHLTILGNLETQRTVFWDNPKTLYILDLNTYLSRCDFEFELESSCPMDDIMKLHDYFESIGVEKKISKYKFKRFLDFEE